MKHATRKAIIFLLLVGVLAFTLRSPSVRNAVSPEFLQSEIELYGMAAPVVFMGLYVLLTIFFFPASVLTVGGGVLFGVVWGTVYTIIAATMAAMAAFQLARWMGKPCIANKLGPRLKGLESKMSNDGFWSMVVLRLLFLPYIALSYTAGLTRMRLVDFSLATFLTNIPGSLAFTFFGASLGEPNKILLGIVYIGLVLCIPIAVKRWKKAYPSTRVRG